MSDTNWQLAQFVRNYLPGGAELVTIDRPRSHYAVLAADLNGDQVPEIAAIYRRPDGQQHLLILQMRGNEWEIAANQAGTGYGVTALMAGDVTGRGHRDFIVGWQIGANWSNLSIYEWKPGSIRGIAPEQTVFSHLDVFRVPDQRGGHGPLVLASWVHDTGEAYRVEVMRWQNGTLAPAPEFYSMYFPRVVQYYEKMVRYHPTYSYYWYYLADAQWKDKQPQGALQSVRKALSFDQPYPSREQLQQLEREIWNDLHQNRHDTGLFPAPLKVVGGHRWGYINRQGTMVLPPQFEEADNFQSNGLAVVRQQNKAGLINASGQFVVPPQYDSISNFSEHRATVITKDGFQLMDETGRIVTSRSYSYIADVRDGRTLFYDTAADGATHYGYLNLEGREVIPPIFMEAGDFSNGKAVVKVKDNEYALIDREGKFLHVFNQAYVGPLSEGMLAFQETANGKYGYLNESGQVVIAPAYMFAQPFQNGRAIVNQSDDFQSKYGVIDKRGRFIIEPIYNDIRELGEGRLALGRAIDEKQPFIGSIYALADLDGKRLSGFVFSMIENFKDGLASVSDSQQTYFINHSGHAAPGYPRLNGSGTLELVDGLIQARVDRRMSYLERNGRVVWRHNVTIPLTRNYYVREEKFKPNKDYLVYYPQLEGLSNPNVQHQVNEKLKKLSNVKPIPANEQLEYTYDGDFEVTAFMNPLLVMELNGYNYPFGAAHGMPSKQYVHINIQSGQMFDLKDLFKPGSNYVSELNAIIAQQIKDDPQYDYVFPDSFKTIKEDQPFFVTQDALHIYFEPYEIAPYVAGFPTFTIPFSQIMGLIDVNGAFWRSFHTS